MTINFIEELKSKNDILEIAHELIPNLKKAGQLWQGSIRSEITPALTIYPHTQSWCHFAGDTTPNGKNGGDVISFIEYVHQCSFQEAVKFLANHAGIELKPPTPEEEKQREEEQKEAKQISGILEKLVLLFEKNKTKAESYLQSRNINPDLIRSYRIGWTNHTLEELNQELIEFDPTIVKQLLSNQSFFNDSLIIPIIEHDRITTLYSRSDNRTPKHLYLPKLQKGIFNHDQALAADESRLYIAEAPLDALSAIQQGITNIVSLGGCRPSEDQKNWLDRIHDCQLVTCFDNDSGSEKNSGYEATKEFLKEFTAAIMKVLPPKDLNDFFKEHKKEDFDKLEEIELPAILLEEISKTIAKDKITQALVELFETLALTRDLPTAEMFVRYEVKAYFDLKARDVEPLIRHFKELRTKTLQQLAEQEKCKEDLAEEKEVQITEQEKTEAVTFLKSTNLVELIKQDLTTIGIIGEDIAKVSLYLMVTSRKMDKPINTTVRGSSGTGKSNVKSKVISLMPKEDVKNFTRVTSKFLEYLPEDALQHKILSIEERAGTEEADYSLRMIEDDTHSGIELGYLKKNPVTGEMEPVIRVVKGPVMVIQTTTKLEMNPENESREFPIYLNESEAQRQTIHAFIKTSALPHKALGENERLIIERRHHNAQRMLEAVSIAVPYSELLEFPTKRARTSRDLKRLLSFIKVSALLHQYQRPKVSIKDKEYTLATLKDYDIAHTFLSEILRNALADLNPTSEELFAATEALQKEIGPDQRFTRADLRKKLDWEKSKVQRAIEPLESAGYLDMSEKKGSSYSYQVLSEDELKKLADVVLSPDKFEERIKQNLNKIDLIYGDAWLTR